MLILGFILMVIGGIWLVIEAFRESVLWGLGVLLIPIVGLIFVVLHWDVAGKPFLIQLAGVILWFVGGGAQKHVSTLPPPRPPAAVVATR